ncbi:uncharacterized protein LOC110987244 [Acanthaster planci]|uniref:Uncharacterized protein LOC110987244 n=1 Tax=Acanthaster planci TaxID=133434 RepID=A0A8B7ZKD6_ACAPL|nr:uncharacterized protein LOC110987244 [Acanthaster planci]XP_022105496.1 uncharacterized protein LOC110987244 [Acanthaster planci]XP_022105497.1 uncharacterized protein LOC110987244 [Acanthaster planci]
MEGDGRWATPVVRPRPPFSRRARSYSTPTGVYFTKTELQLDERLESLSNTAADYENQWANHHATTGRLQANSEQAYPTGKAAYGELKTKVYMTRTNQRPAHSKSFSGADFVQGERLDKQWALGRHRAVSGGSNGSSHEAENSRSSLLTGPGKHLYPHRQLTMQLAEEALPGSRNKRRPGPQDRTPALNIDDGEVFYAHSHVPSPLSSSPSSTSSAASRVNTVSDTSHDISSRPPISPQQRRARRQSSAGESASSLVTSLGRNLRDTSSGRGRRKSTSVLPSITGMTSPQPPLHSHHGPGSRRGLAALGPGSLLRRSLPEESNDDEEDANSVHAESRLLTRKKKISTNVSREYRRAMDELTISDPKPTPPVGKRLLSKRWSSLQSSVLSKNTKDLVKPSGGDRSANADGLNKMSQDSKLEQMGDSNNNSSDKQRNRGWEIVRDNLKTIADMAPKDSIDSKPLTFRNIADLVKAKEFRLMMKRRASFIENGRFQFEEAKQDLYRRYRSGAAGNLAPTAPSESHGNIGRKTDGGVATRVVNRRKFVGLSGSI